jgi:hypothetical protein
MIITYLVTIKAPNNEDRDDVAAALENALDRVQASVEDELSCRCTVDYEPTDEDESDPEDDEGEEDE